MIIFYIELFKDYFKFFKFPFLFFIVFLKLLIFIMGYMTMNHCLIMIYKLFIIRNLVKYTNFLNFLNFSIIELINLKLVSG
jgi:hypothetical protein